MLIGKWGASNCGFIICSQRQGMDPLERKLSAWLSPQNYWFFTCNSFVISLTKSNVFCVVYFAWLVSWALTKTGLLFVVKQFFLWSGFWDETWRNVLSWMFLMRRNQRTCITAVMVAHTSKCWTRLSPLRFATRTPRWANSCVNGELITMG